MKKYRVLDKKELILKCKMDKFIMIKIKKDHLIRDETMMKKIKK